MSTHGSFSKNLVEAEIGRSKSHDSRRSTLQQMFTTCFFPDHSFRILVQQPTTIILALNYIGRSIVSSCRTKSIRPGTALKDQWNKKTYTPNRRKRPTFSPRYPAVHGVDCG